MPSAFSIEGPIPPSPPIPHTHGLPSLVRQAVPYLGILRHGSQNADYKEATSKVLATVDCL